MAFSLLKPNAAFSLGEYGEALQREISSFGFGVTFSPRSKRPPSAIASAFLKANTHHQLIVSEARDELLRDLHPQRQLKIKLEVDTTPPPGFETESRYVLLPVPFSVRVYSLPDLLAGKLHAVLCRRWKTRVKGRDWYDLVWYAARNPQVRLSHLEARMRQSGDYRDRGPLTPSILLGFLHHAVDSLDISQARRETAPFVRDPRVLEIRSNEFLHSVVGRITCI